MKDLMIEKATRRDAIVGAATGLLAGAAGPAGSAQAQQTPAMPGFADQGAIRRRPLWRR